jgi:hypothetical protein
MEKPTGIQDKHGREARVGDIIQFVGIRGEVVDSPDGVFRVKWQTAGSALNERLFIHVGYKGGRDESWFEIIGHTNLTHRNSNVRRPKDD